MKNRTDLDLGEAVYISIILIGNCPPPLSQDELPLGSHRVPLYLRDTSYVTQYCISICKPVSPDQRRSGKAVQFKMRSTPLSVQRFIVKFIR